MDPVISQCVIKARKAMNTNNKKAVELIYTAGNTYQMYFNSFACKFRCAMCNFGYGARFSVDEFKKDFDGIMAHFPDNVRVLVLESTGSFADTNEITEELRRYVFEKLSYEKRLEAVIVETHYTTVTEGLLKELESYFGNTHIEVEFEFGLESINPKVLQFYNKDIDLKKMKKTICEVNEYGFAGSVNILLGCPEFTISEQIQDTRASIEWVMNECPKGTSCVVFPINVKKGSVIGHLYERGKYELIYLWELIQLLYSLPVEWLEYVLIAWWGNRANCFDGETAIVHPYACKDCEMVLQSFCEKFYSAQSVFEKRQALEEVYSTKTCECRSAYERKRMSQEKQPPRSLDKRFEEYRANIAEIEL